MRGVFDEREAERSRKRRGQEKRHREDGDEGKRDREVTLGSFTLVAILFGLVMLCGLSFGLGYVVGRREPVTPSTVLEPRPIAAQGDVAKGKPSGGSGGGPGSLGGPAEVAQSPQGGVAGEQAQERDSGDTSTDAAATTGSKGTHQAEKGGLSTSQVKPAMPAVTAETKQPQSQPKMVQPALETATPKALAATAPTIMVQIATLAHQDDADVLVEALRRKGYAVGAHRDAADGMVHVRVGPFASRDVANQWKQKLLSDGYNAVVE